LGEYDYELRLLASIKYAHYFTEERIDRLELMSIVDMARWAPSFGNLQPWEIIVVDDP
jgi:nitroreductase